MNSRSSEPLPVAAPKAASMRALRWVNRKLSRVFGRVSTLGWGFVLLAGAGLFVGRRNGWDELTIAGCAIGAVFILSVLLTFGRSTYAVMLELADHRVTVGQRALGRIGVHNVGRSRLLPALIELKVGTGAAVFFLPSLASDADHEEVFAVPTSRRGVVTVGPVRSVRGDALGLVRRQVRWTEAEQLFIHPRTVSLRGVRAGIMRDVEGESTLVLSDNDMSFHALREYVPGDDRRNIHWRTSARLGTLMVRQFEDTRRTHTALGLATDASEFASEVEFELAVSLFASIGVHMIREGLELTVLAGPDRLRSQTPPRLLDDCAGLDVRPEVEVTRPLAEEIAAQVPTASMVFMVTGSTTSSTDLRESAAHIPAGIRIVFLSCKPGAELGLQTIGSLSMASIGDARDLPRLMMKLVTA